MKNALGPFLLICTLTLTLMSGLFPDFCSKQPGEDDDITSSSGSGGAGGGSPTQNAAPGTAASVRYNNPGAQYPGRIANMFGSTGTETIGGGHKIAVFDDPVNGAAAQFYLLMSSSNYAGKSLSSAISTWSGGNNVQTYLNVIQRESGLTGSTMLDQAFLNDPNKMISLAKAMAVQESGGKYPMTDAQWQAGYDLAKSKR
jgi:hypothetical protein